MAKRGSNKARSVDHENFIAGRYLGQRNAGSGALDTESGDVITDTTVFECKTTGEPKFCKHEISYYDCDECYRKPTLIARMEKVTDEAYEVGKTPALALRFFDPKSPLANMCGFVDLAVRLVDDDAERETLAEYGERYKGLMR